MTPRTFHNILTGRKFENDRRDAEWKQQIIVLQRIELAALFQFMKKPDWDRAYSELSGKTSGKPANKAKLMTPEEVKAFLDSQNKTK